MTPTSRKITTAAVCTALAVICCVLSAYTPLSFMPLYFASFCIFMCFIRGNTVYGLLCAAATIGLTFVMTGLSVTFFMLVLIFAPYGVICAAMNKFNYRSLKKGLIRAAVMLVAINVLLYLTYFTVSHLLLTDVPLLDWVDTLHGYPIFALVVTVIFAPLDVIFTETAPVVIKRVGGLKIDKQTKRDRSFDSSKGETEPPPVASDAGAIESPPVDVFDETEAPSDFAAHNGIKLPPDKATDKRGKKSKASDSSEPPQNPDDNSSN